MTMKTVYGAFFLSCVLLTGCSTNYTYPSKKITVNKTNGVKKDYVLLSVRGDSVITVLDWAEADVRPISYSHAEILSHEVIKNIIREGMGGGINSTIGAIACGAAAGVLTVALYPPVFHGSDILFFYLPEFLHIVVIAAGVSLGAIAGAAIGDAFPPNIDLLLSSARDREFLRRISLYPEKEPDEMQYIK